MPSRPPSARASASATSCRSGRPSKRSSRTSSAARKRRRRGSRQRWPRGTRSSRSSRPLTSSSGRARSMKRTGFPHRGLPYLLVLPQVVVTLIFFIWPAFESVRLSVYRTSPFGDTMVFVGLENFAKLLVSPEYYHSILVSFIFGFGVTGLAVGGGLFVSALATQNIRGLTVYRT